MIIWFERVGSWIFRRAFKAPLAWTVACLLELMGSGERQSWVAVALDFACYTSKCRVSSWLPNVTRFW